MCTTAPIVRLASVEAETALTEARIQHQEIAGLAYSLWQQRGCCEGSPERDWFEAEQRVGQIEQPSALTRR
jgi:Protein of unknown function (DUF2934)